MLCVGFVSWHDESHLCVVVAATMSFIVTLAHVLHCVSLARVVGIFAKVQRVTVPRSGQTHEAKTLPLR